MKIHIRFLLLSTFIISLLFVQCTSSNKDKGKIYKQLESEIEVLNKKSPMQITESIRFDNCVLLDDNDMENYYTYTDTVVVDDSFFKKIESDVKNMTKNDPGMADIRSYGVSTKYIYRDKKGGILYSFEVIPEDYK